MHNASLGRRILLCLFATNYPVSLLEFGKTAGIRSADSIRHLFAAAILALVACAAAFGQTAEITGRILDPSGSVVPGAEVTVSSLATGADRVVKTNSSGYYTVSLLTPGEYRVSVQYVGFRPIVRSGVRLAVDQHAELGFTL
jgi:hypothetical protein